MVLVKASTFAHKRCRCCCPLLTLLVWPGVLLLSCLKQPAEHYLPHTGVLKCHCCMNEVPAPGAHGSVAEDCLQSMQWSRKSTVQQLLLKPLQLLQARYSCSNLLLELFKRDL
jgi:hypothetical protein